MKQTITLVFESGLEGDITFDVLEENPIVNVVFTSEPYDEEDGFMFIDAGETQH